MSADEKQKLLRSIPSVDIAMRSDAIAGLLDDQPRQIVLEALRAAQESLRLALVADDASALSGLDLMDEMLRLVKVSLRQANTRTLVRAVNATGVVIHTNLGRAPLPDAAVSAMADAYGYCTVEIDPETGRRGSRQTHVSSLIARLSGAEDGMAVNNNAAAVMLTLSTLARGKDVIVSRGELIEIGGSFRIPDIMMLSGARLVEVGTTNKTHPADYRRAVNENTGLILKVHPSNYRIEGFTKEVSLEGLSEISRETGVPLYYDAGSGILVDLERYIGPDEMTVEYALQAGVDVVSFSGDKLLGGPQAGLLAGRADLIARLRSDHMARALRLDKVSLAALEATLRLYTTSDPFRTVPVLRMLSRDAQALSRLADKLAAALSSFPPDSLAVEAIDSFGKVGGGATPQVNLPSRSVCLKPSGRSVVELEEFLRSRPLPIFCTVAEDSLRLNVLTLTDDDLPLIRAAIADFLAAS